MLNSKHQASDRNIIAVKKLIADGITYFTCTGRTRKSFAAAAGPRFTSLFSHDISKIPGVYQQGLLVYGDGGSLIFERFLQPLVLNQVLEFITENQIPVVAYTSDENIFCKQQSKQTDIIAEYGDTFPTEFPQGLQHLPAHGYNVNKLIMLDDESVLQRIRPKFEEKFGGVVTVTKAIVGMLEVLPHGASKGEGVRKLLDHVGVDPERVVAFGDGENDVEMLSLVGMGIAMRNAMPSLKAVADRETLSNDEDGVAVVLETIRLKASSEPGSHPREAEAGPECSSNSEECSSSS